MHAPEAPASAASVIRTRAERRADTLEVLTVQRHLWLATAGDDVHLVPLAFTWDGERLVMVTKAATRTVRNLRATGRARAALGSALDVILIDGDTTITDPAADPAADPAGLRAAYARLPIPAGVPGTVGVLLVPRRVLAWRNMAEIADREIMRDGAWLS